MTEISQEDAREAIKLLRQIRSTVGFVDPVVSADGRWIAFDRADDLLARHPEAPALKPCPFCGGEPELATPRTGSAMRCIYCHNCDVYGPWGESFDDAATNWNRRP